MHHHHYPNIIKCSAMSSYFLSSSSTVCSELFCFIRPLNHSFFAFFSYSVPALHTLLFYFHHNSFIHSSFFTFLSVPLSPLCFSRRARLLLFTVLRFPSFFPSSSFLFHPHIILLVIFIYLSLL
mmetsp:Transcript_40514/g.69112  ORF Transcript_40514/g.69112 Transcript_40514/m.69112 type:complete len:124 (-) Transcript_40514:229-600(-)